MKIQITIESREDGGLRVYSDDLPGLVLSHSDFERVIGDISPALLEILKYLSGRDDPTPVVPTDRRVLAAGGAVGIAEPVRGLVETIMPETAVD